MNVAMEGSGTATEAEGEETKERNALAMERLQALRMEALTMKKPMVESMMKASTKA